MNTENDENNIDTKKQSEEILDITEDLSQNDDSTTTTELDSEETINDYLTNTQENNTITKEQVNTTYKTKTTEKVIDKTNYDNQKEEKKENKYNNPTPTNINYYYDNTEVNNKKGHPLLSFILIVFIIGVLGTCFYLIYKSAKGIEKEESNNTSNIPDQIIDDKTDIEKELDLNDTTVQILYNYIKTNNEEDVLLEKTMFPSKSVFASGLPGSVKNYLGYRLLYDSEIESIKCSDLESDFIDGVVCSNDNSDDASTKFISDEKLKAKVELIFGPNNYMYDNFKVDRTSEYKHSDTLEGFIYQMKQNEENNSEIKQGALAKKLIKAIKKIDTIELYEEQKDEETGTTQVVKYTFLLQDNMYYFYTAEITK